MPVERTAQLYPQRPLRNNGSECLAGAREACAEAKKEVALMPRSLNTRAWFIAAAQVGEQCRV